MEVDNYRNVEVVEEHSIHSSRRTNPNNPAFYKPVRKGLVRRLA